MMRISIYHGGVPLALRFVGIDLAWKIAPPKTQGTGHCIIDAQGRVTEIGLLTTDEEIIELATAEDSWIGLDASLKVPADRRIRNCERELRSMGLKALPTSRKFYHEHYGGCRGEVLAKKLEDLDYEYFGRGPRSYFEIYPYSVARLLLPAPLRYKKGPREGRRSGSEALLRQLQEWEPSLQLPPSAIPPLVEGKGAADRMDALMAAVSLYRHRLYSGTRSLVVGEHDDGYILLPRGGSEPDR
jgi:predicted nuclease with RNAse H fold